MPEIEETDGPRPEEEATRRESVMPWMRVKGGSDYAGVKERTFRSWFRRGLVHCRLPSGLVLIHSDDIDTFIRQYENRGNDVDEIVESVVQDFVMGK